MNGYHYGILVGIAASVALLFFRSLVLVWRAAACASLLQLVGSGFLEIAILTHVCETLRLLPGMGWGQENSAGHYINLASVVIGLTLVPVGFLLYSRTKSLG